MVHERWAEVSQRRKVLGSTPKSRQQSVKGKRVMMRSPFEKKQRKAEGIISQGSPRDFLKNPRELPQTSSLGLPRETFCPFKKLPGKAGNVLASLHPAAGMEEAGRALMPAPPRRPGKNQGDAGRRGKQEASQQMACFVDREWAQIGGHDRLGRVMLGRQQSSGRGPGSQRDAGQKHQGQHDQG